MTIFQSSCFDGVATLTPGQLEQMEQELIALLDANAPNYESVALVVGYENGDGFVLANYPNRLPVLEDSLKRKGTPAVLLYC